MDFSATSSPLYRTRPQPHPRRILVTGFLDWPALGTNTPVHECQRNVSGLLLGGDEKGPLAALLKKNYPDIHWKFCVFPVIWGQTLPPDPNERTGWDGVLSLGVRSSDALPELWIEYGALNSRKLDSPDALGQVSPTARIDPHQSEQQILFPSSPKALALLDIWQKRTTKTEGYTLRVVPARESNRYLCNETHYRWLQESIPEVFFVHLPNTPEKLEELARALLQGVISPWLSA